MSSRIEEVEGIKGIEDPIEETEKIEESEDPIDTKKIEELNRLIYWINKKDQSRSIFSKPYKVCHIRLIKTLKLNLIKINEDAIMSWYHPSPYLYTKTNYTNIPIPPKIVYLTNLRFLDLSYNKIEEIPLEIGELKSLKWLYLNNNDIKEIPVILNQLTNLK